MQVRHHSDPVYFSPAHRAPVLQSTYTVTGATRLLVRPGFSDFDVFGHGPLCGMSGASLDAPEQMASGATVGDIYTSHSRGTGPQRAALQLAPTYCDRA